MPEALTDARWFLAAGVVLIAMALAGSVLRRLPLSSAMIYLAAGAALGPIGLGMIILDPVGGAGLLELVSEIAHVAADRREEFRSRRRVDDPGVDLGEGDRPDVQQSELGQHVR